MQAHEPPWPALDAVHDSAELVELLAGWQSQAVCAARRDEASWDQTSTATHTAADAAHAP